jgi:hypothetical protein
VVLGPHAFGISVAIGEIHDADGAAALVDALHQAAGAQHFVIGMRRDHEQTRVLRHQEQGRGRRWTPLRRRALPSQRAGRYKVAVWRDEKRREHERGGKKDARPHTC